MNWIDEIDKIQLDDGDGTFGAHGIADRQNRKYVTPKEISFNDQGLIIRGRKFSVEKPRLEFAKCLMEFFGKGYMEKIIHKSATIDDTCVIGKAGFGYERDDDGSLFPIPHLGRVVIEENVEIHAHVCIDRGVTEDTVIGAGTKIDNLVHIAHGVKIGKNCLIVAGTVIGGSSEIGNNCFLGINCSIKNKVKIGNNCTIGMGAIVLADVPDNTTVIGVWKKQ
jgi:UDP-3-O-[3-hydroxymyristoyl] glucosamine N-acyltransferase